MKTLFLLCAVIVAASITDAAQSGTIDTVDVNIAASSSHSGALDNQPHLVVMNGTIVKPEVLHEHIIKKRQQTQSGQDLVQCGIELNECKKDRDGFQTAKSGITTALIIFIVFTVLLAIAIGLILFDYFKFNKVFKKHAAVV